MSACPQCGYQNPPEIHICLRCAASLSQRCPQCRAEIPSGSRYCVQCGASINLSRLKELDHLSSSGVDFKEQLFRGLKARLPVRLAEKMAHATQELSGQRREVTILQLEMVDFDRLSQLDAESLYLAVDEVMHLLTDLVYKYEGSIDRFTGQGLTVLFGYPLNHENDAERAVRAALEMQQIMQSQRALLQVKYLAELSIKISLITGFVIAGRSSIQGTSEYTVIGDTLSQSHKILQLAPSRGILCSFSTYQRTRPVIEYSDRPEHSSERTSEALRTYRPVGIRATAGMVRGLPDLATPMIGRSSDLNSLMGAFEKVRSQGSSQIVLCSGDAGIGKSRLMVEFRRALHDSETGQLVTVVQGTCAAYMRITPYRVVAEIIRTLAHIPEQDFPEQQYNALRHYLEHIGLDASGSLAYLLDVLGLLHVDPMLGIRVRMLTPEMLRRQTFLALRAFLLAHTDQSPLVLIFDDLHWVDPASREFIQFLCHSSEQHPFFLLLVSRDFTSNQHAMAIRETALQSTHKPVEISLKPLTEEEERRLLDIIIPDTQPPAAQLKNTICERAHGNPYFTEELVRVLIDHQYLERVEKGWQIRSPTATMIQEVPGTLQGVILARFDLLPVELARSLQKASILGESFTTGLFLQISTEDLRLSQQYLEELEQRGFLLTAVVGSEDGYRFKHPLLREAIYGTLLQRDLNRLHLLVAQSIENGDYQLPGERSETLAHHYARSTQPSKSVAYLLSAAEKAAHNAAEELAIQQLRQALKIMAQAPEMFTQLSRDRAQINLAQALKLTGEFEESAQLLDEIIQRCHLDPQQALADLNQNLELYADATRELADIRSREGRLEDASRLLSQALDLLGEKRVTTHRMAWQRLAERLSWVYFMQSRLEEAYTLVDMALMDEASLESENPITLASLYNTIGGIYWSRSRLFEAIEAVTKSLHIYASLNYQWGRAVALTNLGVLHFSLGKWAQAVEYLEQADELRSEYGYDPERATNLKNLGEILIQLGDHERARAKLETARDISARLGMGINQAYAEFGLLRLALLQKRLPEAFEHLQHVQTLINVAGEVNERAAHYWILHASYEAAAGELHSALQSARRAIAIIDEGQLLDDRSDALRTVGMVYTCQGEFEPAEKHLLAALEAAKSRQDRLEQGQALTELGRLYQRWGSEQPEQTLKLNTQAEKCFDQAISILESLGARYELEQAQANLSQMRLLKQQAGLPREGDFSSQDLDILRSRLGFSAGEWRQAVLVSIQITPKEESDEELIFGTIEIFLPSLVEFIHESGAQIFRHSAGLTAVFGTPVVQEDDPERAVDLAMQILNFYHELYTQTELPISIRIGIDKGRIVAGRPRGDQQGEFIAAGDALQTALQLAGACPPACIWVTEPVRNATAHRFEYKSAGTQLPANQAKAALFELVGLREQILPVRGLIGLKIPFIGRQNELTLLQALGDQSVGGRGALVWIEGEPGIGKSRLMRELANIYSQHDMTVWSAVCSPRSRDVPFSLFSQVLSQAFEIQPHFTGEQIHQQISAHSKNWPKELLESRPFLELLLGAQPEGKNLEQILSLEPEQLRRQTFVAFHRLVNLQASRNPMVIILDDVQWIDAISADLLLYLSHLIISAPVVFICAQRINDASLYEQTLKKTREIHPEYYHHIEIYPLSSEECQELLDESFTSMPIPENLRSLIIQQSGGNPYFIEEFIRMLIEQEYLRINRGKLEISQHMEINRLAIPSSLETLIQARVDALPASTRQVLQVAAVIGGRFHPELLRAIAMREDAKSHLDLLQARGMLRASDHVEVFEFSHPLIETIVYNTVLRAQRKLIHQKTAETLEQLWNSSLAEHAEELGYHFGQAELHEQALNYLILAGERAYARHANDVALNYFERASEMLGAVPDASPSQTLRILCGMGDVYQFIGNYPASMSTLESADHLLQNPQLTTTQRAGLFRRKGDTAFKSGDPEQAIAYLKEALEILGAPEDADMEAEAARCYARMGWAYFIQSMLDQASQAVLTAESYARSANDLNALAAAENLLGGINFRQGKVDQAVSHTRQAMAYWQAIGYSWGVAVTLSNLGVLEVAGGNWQAAYDAMHESLQLRRDMGDVEGVAVNNNNLGSLCLDQGKLELAEAYLRASLAIARPFRLNFLAANSCHGMATTLTYLGKYEEVPDILNEGKRLADELKARDLLSELHRSEAEYELAVGNPESALETASQAYQVALETGNQLYQARGLRIAAVACQRLRHISQAIEKLQSAWEVLQQASDELETARWHFTWAMIAQSGGLEAGSVPHVEIARQIFTRLGAMYDLNQLEAFIRSSR